MGSRANRARRGIQQPTNTAKAEQPAASSLTRPVPDISQLDMAFGNIKHLPPMSEIPDEFQRSDSVYCRLISKWFFSGLKQDDLNRLKPRAGVDSKAALRAIGAILGSFEPKHEHKEAGCAYLLSEWFEVAA